MIKRLINNLVFFFRGRKIRFNPVFIIGCGRSGTTILGETLSQHPRIKYLNERRDLWHKAYPEFDIWTGDYLNPKMIANENDYSEKKTELLRKLFYKQQLFGKSKVLLEKLPINNFRLNFIKKSFPEAKFIYLYRNGLEVSRSIKQKIVQGKWFGKDDLKLNLLLKLTKRKNLNLHKFVLSDIHKGMLEWRLSIEESHDFFRNLTSERFIHFSYQDFIRNPNNILGEIFSFLELDSSEEVLCKLSKNITSKNKPIYDTKDINLKEIGGEILKKTIKNCYSP